MMILILGSHFQLKASAVVNTNKNAAPGEEVEPGVMETVTTVYTLAEEAEALVDLTEAVRLWQEYCTEVKLEERRTECGVLLHSLQLCSSVFKLLRQVVNILILCTMIGQV